MILLNDKKEINVATGQVKTGTTSCVLVSSAIGSCVVITAYNAEHRIGALAHIMLPGRAPETSFLPKTRYAADAIESMLQLLRQSGADLSALDICLIGGGNVLQRKNDQICKANLDSVHRILNEKQLPIRAKAIGGVERRTVRFDLKNGKVFYTQAESDPKLLWDPGV
ncbi:MAG: chemotaxis protein CheD [candidate division KSB1 bacterium]|nr:chemotaxis protein CheD [candidate division KSB1 bacterium]